MLKISTLKGQIAIGILLSLLIPGFVDYGVDTNISLINLFIQLFGLCVLFGIIKNGKGSEFKVTRINIAIYLWGVFWLKLYGSLVLELEQAYRFDRFLPKVVLYASYNTMVIAMVVLLSYVIGKWIIGKIVKEETLFSRSTLKGQIAICISLSLPIPTIMDGLYVVKYALILLIPFVVFCVLFWIKNSKGAEFKVTRIMIATLLWGAFGIESFSNGKYREILKWTGLDELIFQINKSDSSWPTTYRHLNEVAYASYNAVGIAMVVIFSYVIGKWINSKIGDQINEKRE